ncbi:MAG TPA: tetratricopeptide repeat protein [Thermomicrobiales bacterium]|nr:tetratricopeptide repeat protein [Thermomicrobiales bacterium]
MAGLPQGTVTFLFTDIEGSTRLWERDPDAMRRAVARHDRILATAVRKHAGDLYKHVGDAIQAAFAAAPDAVAAAIDAQRALARADWPETGPIRVRMAIHAGPAKPNAAGDYNQVPCLNRLSRLLSTGYGGQILLTDCVRERLPAKLPHGATPRDLGRHRLRDLLEPERVAQVVIPGLPDHFPPLASLDRFPTNLPQQPNPLLGREADLTAVQSLVRDGARRLVTLTGAGGAGKTRLAIQAAADLLDQFEDGAFLVELGRVADPALVVPAIADTLGVREGGGLSQRESLVAYLQNKTLLLVLDNLEQVVGCGPDLADLLAACPNVRMIATSRLPLRIGAEQLYEVAPLPAPKPNARDVEAVGGAPAAALFVERARAHAPGFTLDAANAPAVAAICRRLDGLPLAIELAAAQLRRYTPAELLAELDHRFALLAGGDPSRLDHQQALASTIAWSYDRLSPPARRLARQLAVFAAAWTRDAARAVLPDGTDPAALASGVGELVDASLLRCAPGADGATRCAMLESIRAFGLERLAQAGEETMLRERHAAWCETLAADAAEQMTGPEQASALDRLAAVHDDLRAALAWLADHASADRFAALAASLWRFWQIRGFLTEGRRWFDQVLAKPDLRKPARLAALVDAGILAEQQGDYAAAERQFQAGLDLARELADQGREAALLNNLGAVALYQGQPAEAQARFEQSLARSESIGDRRRAADALANLGGLAHFQGERDASLRYYTESLRYSREANDVRGAGSMLLNILLLISPDPAETKRARSYGEEALRSFRKLGDRRLEAFALSGLGIASDASGAPVEAANFHRQSLAIFEELDDLSGIGRAAINLGLSLLDNCDAEQAVPLLRRGLAANRVTAEPHGIALALDGLAAAATPRNPTHAARIFAAASQTRDDARLPVPPEAGDRHAATMAALQAALGSDYETALADSALISVDEAIERAFCDNRAQPRSTTDGTSDPLAAIDALVFDSPRT